LPRGRRLVNEIKAEIALGLLGQAHVAAGQVLPFGGQASASGRSRTGAEAGGKRAILLRRGHGGPLPCVNCSHSVAAVSFDIAKRPGAGFVPAKAMELLILSEGRSV